MCSEMGGASPSSSETGAAFSSGAVMASAHGLQDNRLLPGAWHLSLGPR